MRKGLMAAAVGGMMAIGAAAQAETVTFTTSFVFNETGNSSIKIGGGTFTLGGVTGTSGTVPTGTNQVFGNVSFSGAGDASIAPKNPHAFTFFVNANSDTGSSTGQAFTGTVNATGGLATLDFNGGAQAGGFLFTPNAAQAFNFFGSTVVGSTSLNLSGAGFTNEIRGSISALPVPAAVWGGMALLGTLGGARLRRRFQDNAGL